MAKARTGTVSLFADMKKVNHAVPSDGKQKPEEKNSTKQADMEAVKEEPAEVKLEKSVDQTSEPKVTHEKKETSKETAVKTEKKENTEPDKAVSDTVKEKKSDKIRKKENADAGERVVITEASVTLKQPDGICQTSVSIQQSSANFLRYWSKKTGVNQDTGLAQIISEEMQTGVEQIPDFFALVERRSRTGCVSKSIRLPEKILAFAKEQAANEMKTLGAYVDDLLQKRMKEVQAGH